MIAEEVCTHQARKSKSGRVLPAQKTHSMRLAHCRHFTAFAELFSLLFLVVSFQDSLTLEEPVKVLKVGLSIYACRVACGDVDRYKANFRL